MTMLDDYAPVREADAMREHSLSSSSAIRIDFDEVRRQLQATIDWPILQPVAPQRSYPLWLGAMLAGSLAVLVAGFLGVLVGGLTRSAGSALPFLALCIIGLIGVRVAVTYAARLRGH